MAEAVSKTNGLRLLRYARNDRKGRDKIAEPVPNVVRNPAPRNDNKRKSSQLQKGEEVLIARMERNKER